MARTPRDDGGETLLEVLIAVVILGLAGAAILGTLGETISGSTQHRKEATALTVATSAAEYVKSQGYQASCGSMAAPPSSSVNPNGFTVSLSGPTEVSGGACVATDTLELYTVTVTYPGDSSATKTLKVVVRKNT